MAATVKVAERAQIVAKIETTEGTPIALAAADAALRATNIRVTPRASYAERAHASAFLGYRPSVTEGEMGEISFDFELSGSGTAGTAPSASAILRCAGWSETVVAVTSVTYAGISEMGTGATQIPSMTIAAMFDGLEYRLAGARVSSFEWGAEAGKRILVSVTVMGKWSTHATTALWTGITYQSTPPLLFKAATFTLNGVAAKCMGFKFNMGIAAEMREDGTDATGYSSCAIVDRKPTATFNVEAPPVSEINYFALAQAATQFAFAAVFGATAGNILTVSAPKVQCEFPQVTPAGRRLAYNVGCRVNMNAGHDELVLAFT